jgi:menaquinone-dependent protoporphyrinogen oxidase
VELRAAADVDDISRYSGLVLGGALYTGRWHRDVRRLLSRHRAALAGVPVAVLAIGPTTTEPEDLGRAREQLDRALTKVPELEPVAVGIFGGVVDPAKLHFPFNRMPAVDARDPAAIRSWALEVAAALEARARRGPRAVRT